MINSIPSFRQIFRWTSVILLIVLIINNWFDLHNHLSISFNHNFIDFSIFFKKFFLEIVIDWSKNQFNRLLWTVYPSVLFIFLYRLTKSDGSFFITKNIPLFLYLLAHLKSILFFIMKQPTCLTVCEITKNIPFISVPFGTFQIKTIFYYEPLTLVKRTCE